MSEQRIGIIMNGVTGRMGLNQHLVRSILAIRKQGGVALADGTRLLPDPILVGRNGAKLEQIAKQHGVARWTTDLAGALANANPEAVNRSPALSSNNVNRLMVRSIRRARKSLGRTLPWRVRSWLDA